MADDKAPKGPGFSAYVLLKEAIQFTTAEIEAAVREDFPSLDLVSEPALAMDNACNTDDFITWPLFMGAKGQDAATVSLIRLPGYGTWDPEGVPPRQMLQCPDIKALLGQNASYICVSLGAASSDMADAFRAARLCSCIAAVFAKLPVALAVYWESGDHFLSTEATISMAEKSITDAWPIEQWIGISPARSLMDGQEMSGALTVGAAAFKGAEISYAAAPVDLGAAVQMTYGTATMMLEYGSVFKDGDTLGAEGQAKEDSHRIRLIEKGTEGATCDVVLLVHPQSPADHAALAGPITSQPPPEGVDNSVRAKPGFLKRLLRGRRDT